MELNGVDKQSGGGFSDFFIYHFSMTIFDLSFPGACAQANDK
jgi:hypothetical protein